MYSGFCEAVGLFGGGAMLACGPFIAGLKTGPPMYILSVVRGVVAGP